MKANKSSLINTIQIERETIMKLWVFPRMPLLTKLRKLIEN